MNIELKNKLESELLADMILDQDNLFTGLADLTTDVFDDSRHKIIFEALKDCSELYQEVSLIDLTTRISQLSKTDDVEYHIRVFKYIDLITSERATTGTFDNNLKLLKREHKRYKAISTLQKAITSLKEIEDPEEVLSITETNLKDLNDESKEDGLISIDKDLEESLIIANKKYKDPFAKPEGKLLTGYSEIDLYLDVYPQQFGVICARPAMGKTSFMLNLANGFLTHNEDIEVGLFSLEMSRQEIVNRYLSQVAEVNFTTHQVLLEKDGITKLTRTVSKITGETEQGLKGSKLFIDDNVDLDVNKFRAKIRKFIKRHPKCKVILVDYIQLMDDDSNNNSDNRVNVISKITRIMKKVSREFDITVIGLSQLSRDLEKRANKRPQLSDLRESGSIEQDCDWCLAIYRDEVYNPDTEHSKIAEIIFLKQRRGIAPWTVKMYFNAVTTNFHNLEKGV